MPHKQQHHQQCCHGSAPASTTAAPGLHVAAQLAVATASSTKKKGMLLAGAVFNSYAFGCFMSEGKQYMSEAKQHM
jgi:hypothetical protein